MDEKYTLASFFTVVTSFLTGFLSLTHINTLRLHWSRKIVSYGFSLFFLFLAFDEFFEIHEYLNTVIKLVLKSGSSLSILAHFSWIFPLSVFVLLVFVLLVAKIFQEQNTAVKKHLMHGVFCFVGVLILEIIGSATFGKSIYLVSVAFEEGLEMIGVCFFLYATLLEKI